MWFVWNSIDSRDMGIWVTELPQPVRAAERVEDITILGRAGTLTLKQGENVHESYTKECRITVRSTADYQSILTWLSGDGEVIFANEPDKVYFAHITNEIRFTRDGNSLRTASIPFSVHPHKGMFPPEKDISITDTGTFYNPGTVASRPLITLTVTGTATIDLDGNTMVFTATEDNALIPQEIAIDCDTELITCNGEIWDGSVDGDFLQIEPGNHTFTGTAIIKPRWRWY